MLGSELSHESEIFLEKMIMIASHVQRITVFYPSPLPRKGIPDRGPLAIGESGSFNLRSRSRKAPDEVFRKGQRLHPRDTFDLFFRIRAMRCSVHFAVRSASGGVLSV